jgi:hypothetical protein
VQITASTGQPSAAAAATWGTTVLAMRWQDHGGWRAQVSAATASPGPTPPPSLSSGTPSSDLDIVAADHDFTAYTPTLASTDSLLAGAGTASGS